MLAAVFRGSRLSKGANDAALEREMRRGITSFEDSGCRDELAWLLLRIVAELSPCPTNSLIAHVSGDIPRGEPGRVSHTRKLVLDALLKLEILDLINSSQEQIVLTDKGRQCGNKPAVAASQSRSSRSVFVSVLISAESSLKRLYQDCSAAVHLVTQRILRMKADRLERAAAVAIQVWHRNAP